ncbi:major capsid protein [Mycolicibacterium iranicum]|uniref:major capsid protein n=1 Tax=Mycolicibacterium iranicum TaxID=912594 RepID=UPI000464FB5E|nr:major capsid protein [Mycolicibacterium iranicum]
MTSALTPQLNGRTLSVDVALRQPSIIQAQIAQLADEVLLLPKFLRQHGAPLIGGGLLFHAVQASDFYSSDVELRSPGAEYRVIEGVNPDPQLANVEDWGGKFFVADEQITRNQVNYLDQQTTQLANTIARKLDTRLMAKVAAAGIGSLVPATGWANLKFVGPLDQITASAFRPSAHWAEVQEMADLEELGVQHDLLVVHPTQAKQLRTAYGADLDAALESAGFTNGMFSNPRIPAGTAYAVQEGEVGTIGWESAGLVVDIIDDRHKRGRWVQAFAVPAIAIDRPYAAKRISGLSA